MKRRMNGQMKSRRQREMARQVTCRVAAKLSAERRAAERRAAEHRVVGGRSNESWVTRKRGRIAGLALIVAAVMAAGGLIGCTPLQDFAASGGVDLEPPRFVSLAVVDSRTVTVTLDKPAEPVEYGLSVTPSLGEIRSETTGNELVISTELAAEPGAEYLVEATVEDASGNSLSFLARFFGHNERVPQLLINELNPRGTGNNPETVELIALSDGNLAGITLYNGTAGSWDSKLILPPEEVAAGDFLLAHFRPHAAEHETALNFWVPEGAGLPTNNGVVTLYTVPGGAILDAVIYSDRTSESDERYRGFGTTRMMQRVDEVVAAGAWLIEGELARPEDVVDVTLSTATRSLNRSSDSANSNSRADWHVVPTRGSTFGETNSDELHEP